LKRGNGKFGCLQDCENEVINKAFTGEKKTIGFASNNKCNKEKANNYFPSLPHQNSSKQQPDCLPHL